MASHEFEEARDDYEAGRLSRRRFVAKLIAGGATAVAAVTFVNASTAMAAPGTGGIYGTPPGQGGIYGTPPGQGGTPPGKGGTPPGLRANPPGLGGTPPGQGGTPPGRLKRS